MTDISSDLSFQKFDSSGGKHLTGVTLQMNMGLDTIITVRNGGISTSRGKAATEIQLGVTDPGSLFSDDPQLTFDFAYANFSNLAGGGSTTLGPFSGNASSTSSYSDGAILAEFTGPGAISLNLASLTQTLIAFSGGVTTASQVSHVAGDVIVSYDYTETPGVPDAAASSALLALGFGPLLLLRRRIARK